jgi:PAS domain S-box-containing protein
MLLSDDSIDQRLAQLLRWLCPTIVGFAIVYATIGGVYQDWRTVASACGIGAHGLLTMLAQFEHRRGHRYRASYLVAGGAVGSILIITMLQPALYSSMVVVPFLIAAMLLQYAAPRHTWYCLAGCCAASMLVILLGETVPRITRLPESIVSLLRLSSLTAMIIFALVMLGQFSSRLQDMLTRLRAAYARLEAQHAELARLSYQHQLILNSAGEGIYGVDARGIVTFVNPTAASMFGWDVSELIGQLMHTCTHHAQTDGIACPLLVCPMCAVLEDGVVRRRTDEVFWRKDGTSFPVEYVSAPIHEQGAIGGAVVLFRDITERKQAEEALQRSEQLYRTLAGNLPNGAVFLFDYDLRFKIADGQALLALGFTRTALEGKTLWEVLPPEISGAVEPFYRAALAGEECAQEATYGDRAYVSYYLPVRNEQGEVFAGMIMSHDITDRKRAEQALIEERALLARRVEERTAELSAANVELARAARLKDEFLASMSHELRTPLNAILGLAETLQEQIYGALTSEQDQALQGIEESGRHLLTLINDILDLAKIESGTMTIEVSEVRFGDLRATLDQSFIQVASDKGLGFSVGLDETLPPALFTDGKRLQQVLRNLISNAIKFTEHGQVAVRITSASEGWSLDHESLNRAGSVIAFAVADTGIGIAADKQKIIFEPFQQADGTTTRKYGGTGLGLSISRDIAWLLGGEIRLSSTPGEGSIFTLYLPHSYQFDEGEYGQFDGTLSEAPMHVSGDGHASGAMQHATIAGQSTDVVVLVPAEVPDDRDNIQPGDRVLLIVEDDTAFARILLDTAREKGFKGVIALRGDDALYLAHEYKPVAITLDLKLPVVGGWTIFDLLKHDPATRHIPIHIISAADERQRGLQLGAIAYLKKPVTREALTEAFAEIRGFVERQARNLLVVEDDQVQRNSIVELIGNGDVVTTAVGSGAEALEALKGGRFDCMVLDLGLPDMTGSELIDRIKREVGLSDLPIIVYTGKELTRKEETELKRMAETIIVKDVQSLDRLLAETALFLHRVEANLPQPKRQMLERLHKLDPTLVGKKVLIVDDDVRNIFAITSMLERYQMQVVYAENGRDGLEVLQSTPEISIILMDVMMPEMDGYETMRAIRRMRKYKTLPIIALTAKAMKGDREKCIDAGASDYITKPVDTEQLLSLLRVWLYK